MNQEMFNQLIELAGQAGDGAFWLVVIALGPKYLAILLTFSVIVFAYKLGKRSIIYTSSANKWHETLKEIRNVCPDTRDCQGHYSDREHRLILNYLLLSRRVHKEDSE